MSKKPSWYVDNSTKLVMLCDELGLELEYIGELQWRVYGATHVIDIWPSRMVYHRISGENIKAIEPYSHDLDQQFNKKQVKKLLEMGEL